MKIIISDYHIGTTMWQKAMLECLGHSVIIKTLSSHAHYLDNKTIFIDDFFKNIGNLNKEQVEYEFNRKYSDVTHILCGFPPKRVEDFKYVPERVKIILNIAHRIHIHLKSYEYDYFMNKLIDYSKNNKYILATMSEYDYQYVKYYTNIDTLKLFVTCLHLPKNVKYNPSSNIILIGPTNNNNTLINFNNLNEINQNSIMFSQIYNKNPFFFNFIKNVYPETNLEYLTNHPAILIFPYSAFSISMVELYQLNIPLIFPSNELLKGKMNDVKLFPIYNEDKNFIIDFNNKYKKEIPSPNSFNPEEELFWFRFMYFNQVKNILKYHNNNHLFEIIYNTDFNFINNKMIMENSIAIEEGKNNWIKIFN